MHPGNFRTRLIVLGCDELYSLEGKGGAWMRSRKQGARSSITSRFPQSCPSLLLSISPTGTTFHSPPLWAAHTHVRTFGIQQLNRNVDNQPQKHAFSRSVATHQPPLTFLTGVPFSVNMSSSRDILDVRLTGVVSLPDQAHIHTQKRRKAKKGSRYLQNLSTAPHREGEHERRDCFPRMMLNRDSEGLRAARPFSFSMAISLPKPTCSRTGKLAQYEVQENSGVPLSFYFR